MSGVLDQQLMVAAESTYGTPVTVTKGFEYNTESIQENEMRTEGDPLRLQFFKRNDRFTPYFGGASGSLQLDVMTKGFGFWLKQMLGAVATSGPTESTVYTHTGTVADLLGTSHTLQVTRNFYPAGTVQSFTYEGGKVTGWTLSNSVDANLVCDLELDYEDVKTNTATATASYPSSMENLTWAGGVVSIGGSSYDVDEISVQCNNNLAVDRRQIRASTLKKEPTGGRRDLSFSITADFDSMTQRDRAHATTRSASLAAITATWNGPTLLGTTLFPQLQISIPAARFDQWQGANSGPEGIKQTLSGVGLYDGTNSAVSIVYKSADVTP